MEYSTHVLVQQVPISEQNFETKLQDVSNQITSNGYSCPTVFAPLNNIIVQQAAISSSHIAFLLQDGRICRISYRVLADKIEPVPPETTKSKPKIIQPTRPQSRTSIRPGFERPSFENLVLSSSVAAAQASGTTAVTTNSTAGQSDIIPQLQAGYPLSRPRHHLIRTARGRTGIIFGSRPLIPASSVPEELIEQVHVVLQGKSRNVIIRELQRTNLDVNMAVNNLLARDDEGDDDLDDDYVGADLISLLDVNPHGESGIILESEFFDEADFALRYNNIQRRVSARIGSGNGSGSSAAAAAAVATAIDGSSGSLSSSTNPSTVVASAPSSTSNSSGERKRSRYDPRWLDGSLREELFGRIERELKADDLSISKEQLTNGSLPSKTTKLQQLPQAHHHHSHSNNYNQHSSVSSATSLQQQQQPQSINSSVNIVQQTNPITFGDQLEYWTDGDNNYLHFTHIACLYSELIAINISGELCQWRWIDDYPYQDPDNSQIKHPKTSMLLLTNEKLISLSANIIRASVLTETNKVATWIDETLGQQVSVKLQHQAQELPFSTQQQIIEIQTSPLFTVVRTDLNEIYWYGILPTKQRKKLLERIKDKTRKHRSTNVHSHHLSTLSQQITQGCSVCLISNPYYNQGAWGFYIKDGQPKFGQLMEQAWVLTNTARFKIKTPDSFTTSSSLAAAVARLSECDKSQVEMPPPPSPASSTCSVDSSTGYSGLKRRKQSTSAIPPSSQSTSTQPLINNACTTSALIDNSNDEHQNKIKDEEYWPIEEVVFIEDCKVAPIGKVIKIDGSLVLVRFPSKINTHPIQNTNEMSMETNTSELDNCRILRKDDLQIVKGNMTPKIPDCSLSIANSKKISLENGTLLTFSIDKDYLHTLQLRETTVYYIQYEIGSNNGQCRSIRQNFLPSITNRQSLISFLGSNTTNLSTAISSSSLRLHTLNTNEIPHVLLDGNKTFYPFVYNQDLTNIKDPQWKNLLPLNYFQQQIVPIKNADHLPKSHIILSIMQIQKGLLIPHILRYDYDKIRSILNEIETTKNKDLLKLILNERLDGCRNIFHACVAICVPLSNKDYSTVDTLDLLQPTTPLSTTTATASYPWNPVTNNNENNNNSKRISFSIDLLHNQTMNTSTTSNNDHNYQGTRTRTNERSEVSTWPSPLPPSQTNETENTQQQSSTVSAPPQQAQTAPNFYRSLSAGNQTNSTSSLSSSSNTNTNTFSSKFQQIQYLQHQFQQQQQAIAALAATNANGSNGSAVGGSSHSSGLSATTSSQPVFGPVIYAQNTSSYQQGSRSSRTTTVDNEYQIWSSVKYDEKERRLRSIKILHLLLDFPLFQEYLIDLLSFRNVEGSTPFMSAVNSRAYNCALILFEYASKLAKKECLTKITQANSYDHEQQQRNEQFFLDNTSTSPPLFESTINCLNVSSINRSEYQSILMKMIYPSDSTNFDDSPLYTICTNDTCSFTWTGEDHINQDIFECKTCGLHGTLCCCTECAQTCHKGHDCRLKRTSPTAYCDCWEVCKCKSLISGEQSKRLELFKLLLLETNLVQMKNNRYENILLYLTQTVGRQIIEQQQFGKNTQSTQQQLQQTIQQAKQQRATGGVSAQTKKLTHTQQLNGSANNINNSQTDTNDGQGQLTIIIPDHDLEPSQFCRRALELILADWYGVKSMLLSGCKSDDPSTKKVSVQQQQPLPSSSLLSYNNESLFSLDQQQLTTQLDRFTYFLLAKCNIKQGSTITTKNQQSSQNQNDMIDILLQTLLKEMANPVNKQLAKYAAARFVRSVLRLFVTLTIESQPDKSISTSGISTTNSSNISGTNGGLRRFISTTTVNGTTITGTGTCYPQSHTTTSSMIIQHCKRIFHTLIKISIRELASMAEALIAPVRYGCAKPTAYFQLVSTTTDAIQSLEEVFNVDSQYYRAYQENNLSNVNAVSSSNGVGNINNVRRTLSSTSTMGVGSATVTTTTAAPTIITTSYDRRSRDSRPGVSNDDNYADIVEQDLDNDLETGVGAVDDDDSDTQSQHGGTDRIPTGTGSSGTRDGGTGVLSDNESEMELELLAESDTDNESNRSAILSNAQRTSATAGSDPGMTLFSDDDSGESTNDDADSVRSDSVLDETSQQELMSFDDNRDQMSTTTTIGERMSSQQPPTLTGTTTTTVPTPAYQTSNTTSTRLTTTTRTQASLFGETHLRRQIQPLNASTGQQQQQQQTIQQSSHQHQSQQQQQQNNISSTNTTNVMLARAFSILIKQMTDLLLKWTASSATCETFSPLYHDIIPDNSTQLNTDSTDTINMIQTELEQKLLPTWQWFCTIMDSFESQIRFGVSLSNLLSNETDTTIQGNRFLKTIIERAQVETKKKTITNRLNVNPQPTEPVISSRRDSLNYVFSLMRMPENEHGDQIPIIDVLSYKHIAYIFDSFIYYLKESQEQDSSTFKTLQYQTYNRRDIDDRITNESNTEDTNDDHSDTPTTLFHDQFFHRSNSTLCLGSLAPDPFLTPIDDSLPLACRPQLLQPVCRKEDLFGRFLYENAAQRYAQLSNRLGLSDRQDSIPNFIQPNYSKGFKQQSQDDSEIPSNKPAKTQQRDDDRMAVDVLLDLSSGLSITSKQQLNMPTNNRQFSTLPMTLPTISTLPTGSYEYLMTRWRYSLDLFVKLFIDDIGAEPGSIIYESGGFQAREQRFRHDMERLKNLHQKDIRFESMERDRTLLIQKTFRTLNSHYYRTQNINPSSTTPPLAVQRVKVTFKDEPGEGSGVARSFYAAIIEAILSDEKLPHLEIGSASAATASQSTHQRQQRSRESRTLATYLRRSMLLSPDARSFKPILSPSGSLVSSTSNTVGNPTITSTTDSTSSNESSADHWTPSKIKIGLAIYPKVAAIQPFHAEKITGMLLEGLPTPQLQRISSSSNDDDLRVKIEEAMNVLALNSIRETPIESTSSLSTKQSQQQQQQQSLSPQPQQTTFDKRLDEYAPLFWQPDKKEFYAPRPGKYTTERLTAYRNVGRLIGLCLLQNELLPLPMCRHVIKYILNRPIRWHDLAFFDSSIYENLRRAAYDAEKTNGHSVKDLHLTFSLTCTDKEGGETYDLITNGSSKDVTYSNLYDFIKHYAEFRMVKLVEQSLHNIRLGVFDVIPSNVLDGLSAEDFRLLLNGSGSINIKTLMNYTTFNDESGEAGDRITQFKKWFWSVLEKFGTVEKQDLVYFWTGSPALPASEGGFQPMPSVTIRPSDDQHLPTANTYFAKKMPGLDDVQRVIVVLSGKGGVGKSTVSVQLSLCLKNLGYRVGLLDVDLCGPSIPRMFGLETTSKNIVYESEQGWTPIYIDESKTFCIMSIGFLLENLNDAIIWRGPRKMAMIQRLITGVNWSNLDYLIIDTPPGTSDEHIT
ncbi:unnamed protein product, partial [Didymodactylos carnosus]